LILRVRKSQMLSANVGTGINFISTKYEINP